MSQKSVEVITCESGDWEVLKYNGEIVFEGHSIPNYEWMSLLKKLYVSTSSKEITDEEMENGNY